MDLEKISSSYSKQLQVWSWTLENHHYLLWIWNLKLMNGLNYSIFYYEQCDINLGMRYLGFLIKPNDYHMNDRGWLISYAERKLNQWCNKWLSRAWFLILIKSIIEGLLIYWITIAHIPQGITITFGPKIQRWFVR